MSENSIYVKEKLNEYDMMLLLQQIGINAVKMYIMLKNAEPLLVQL